MPENRIVRLSTLFDVKPLLNEQSGKVQELGHQTRRQIDTTPAGYGRGEVIGWGEYSGRVPRFGGYLHSLLSQPVLKKEKISLGSVEQYWYLTNVK